MDKHEHPFSPVLTESETAQLLGGLSVSGLRKWRKTGKGPKYLRLGRLIRYRRADIEAWLESHCDGQTSNSHVVPGNV